MFLPILLPLLLAPTGDARACLGLPLTNACVDPAAVPGDGPEALNVKGAPLAVCSRAPVTGWRRDGRCHTGPRDRGLHVVCAQVTDAFLQFSKARGNDLIRPAPRYGFPGLKAGDRWCLCADRWAEATAAGAAPPVVLDATHARALMRVPAATLEAAAISAPAGRSRSAGPAAPARRAP